MIKKFKEFVNESSITGSHVDTAGYGGRGTGNYGIGDKITSLDQLVEGTVCVSISHQFQSVNVLVIRPRPDEWSPNPDAVSASWLHNPNGPVDNSNFEEFFTIWDFELTAENPNNEYYLAIQK